VAVTTLHQSHCLAAPTPREVEQAALRAVAYADVFGYPLQATEVHRYLHGVAASPQATAAALARCSTPEGSLSSRNGYYTLRGREGLVEVRGRRAALAEQLWPAAVTYGHLIASFPFVRMVAVTGSLAWHNIDDSPTLDRPPDIDYMIVTEPGRLWLCRWVIGALRHVLRLRGVFICPNYIISTRALAIADRNLYTAYELARMTPIAGLGMHRRLRRANPWVRAYLPNAGEAPRLPEGAARFRPGRRNAVVARLTRLARQLLGSPLGTPFERLEMTYRIHKLLRLSGDAGGEVEYGVDCFKGFTSGHARENLAAFALRLRDL
jgi:hypothetical protein